MKVLIGKGIFGWEGEERRSNRYGAVHLSGSPYEGAARAEVFHDLPTLNRLEDWKVRLTVKVVESRQSTHVGDKSLQIFPTQPEVGEEIDLGVGWLAIEKGYDGTPDVVLRPDDGRRVFWMDPNKLYRLHDQTVEVYIEETDEPCSPAPKIQADKEPVAFNNGDGTFQVKNVRAGETVRIEPHIERLGRGLFVLQPMAPPGQKMKVRKGS